MPRSGQGSITFFEVTDGVTGIDGFNQATINIYKAATATPGSTDKPIGDTTYTFDGGGGTSLARANGWTTDPPTPAAGESIYIRIAAAVSRDATDIIEDSEWSGAVQVGSQGVNGINSATVALYQRNDSDTAPTDISNDTTYTFSSGTLTTPNNGWTQTVPVKGTNTRLWYITATAAANTTTDGILASEWSAPQILSEDGTNGENGTDAPPAVSYSITYDTLLTSEAFSGNGRWKVSSSATAIPSGTGVDTWSSSLQRLFLSPLDSSDVGQTAYLNTLGAGDYLTFTSTETGKTGTATMLLSAIPVLVDNNGTTGGTLVAYRFDISDVVVTGELSGLSTSTTGVTFGFSRARSGVDGTQGSRGAGRFDRTFIDDTPPTVGDSEHNDDALRTICEAHGGTYTEATNTCSVELGQPQAGDTVVLTYFPGGTVAVPTGTASTRGAIHDGTGTANNDWTAYAVQIDGNLLVDGTITANKIATGAITISTISGLSDQLSGAQWSKTTADANNYDDGAKVFNNGVFYQSTVDNNTVEPINGASAGWNAQVSGSVSTAGRVTIDAGGMRVFDASNNLRVIVGDLS